VTPPGQEGVGVLSQTALLKHLKSEGCPISRRQLELFRKWGIVPEPVDGRYPEEAVGRVKFAHDLAKQGVRSLARRVLLMYVGPYEVAPEKTLEALRRLSRETHRKQPRRKLKIVARVLEGMARYNLQSLSKSYGPLVRRTGPSWVDVARRLDVRKWRTLIDRADPEDLNSESFGFLRYTLSWAMCLPEWKERLQEIPAEERLLLLFVLWLEREKKGSPRSRSTSQRAGPHSGTQEVIPHATERIPPGASP
jgi:hypothetical protein